MPGSMGFVDFVDPELGLEVVDNIDKGVCVHVYLFYTQRVDAGG
jgi:hypothetical protein